MELLQKKAAARRGKGEGIFVWCVVLLVMTGVCFASWIGSFYVIGHPENPRCYAILKRCKRVDPPKRFAVTEAPKGEFLSAAKLLERFGRFGKVELANENALLLRNYLTNFRESGRRVAYVAGRFQIVQSFALSRADWFPSGAVAIAQSETMPQMLVEFFLPARPAEVGAIRDTVAMGVDLTLQRSQDLWALVHVERHADGRMQFTVVPLPYGGWQLKNASGSFALRSPEELLAERGFALNLAAGLPIVRDPRLRGALAEHKEFRRKVLARASEDQAALSGPELVRLDPEIAPAPPRDEAIPPAPSEPPAISSAAAARPNLRAPRAQVARPNPTPAPAKPLPPVAAGKAKSIAGIIGAEPPEKTSVPVAAVPPPPRPAPGNPAEPGPHARARQLSTAEASALVDHYPTAEIATLAGDFVVTGVLGRRVALRTCESLRDASADPTKPGSSAALVAVEFPAGLPIPEKDATFTRDRARGFLIRDVITAGNGQIMILANEAVEMEKDE